MPPANRTPVDGFRVLSAFDVQPSPMDSSSLRLNWRWNSSELAKRLIRKAKITHFSEVGLTTDDEYRLNDLTAESYTLGNLQPDTRYTVCIHITRDWHPTPVPVSSGSDRSLSSTIAQIDQTHSDAAASRLWSKVASGLPEPVRTVTERECRVAVTSWFYWPALISSLVGIFIAILISFSIFMFLKRAHARLKKARRDQKKAYCTDHTHPMLSKHPDASGMGTCAQGHGLKCPHHRCPHCHLHATHAPALKQPLSPNPTSSTSVLIPHHHHHYHHHHHHHHRHHAHRHPLPSRTQSPSMAPLTDTTEKSEGEQMSCASPLNPPSGDLLSIDMAQSLSGSDSYQFSSTSSADDRLGGTSRIKVTSPTVPVSSTSTELVTNTLSPTGTLPGLERKRTVSFLLSERKKSITEKLRSKSIDKTILDGWSTKKLPFGFRKPKKGAGRNSVAEALTNIPQVTVTLPDVTDASHPVKLETRSPTIEPNTFRQKPKGTEFVESLGKSVPDTNSQIHSVSTDLSIQSDSNSKPTTPPQQTNNVLSPTLPERDTGSANSSVMGSDRESNEVRPTFIPAALSVKGFKVALDTGPDPGQWDGPGDLDRTELHPISSIAPVVSVTASSAASSAASSRGRSSVSPVSPPPCVFDRPPTQQQTQDSSIFFTQLIETL